MQYDSRTHHPNTLVHNTQGATLIWALVVALVLLIATGIIASILSVSSHRSAVSQTDTQAYYTARSVSERISTWLSGTSRTLDGNPTEQQRFIAALPGPPPEQALHQDYSAADLGNTMGTAEVDIWKNSAGDQITIVTTAYFGAQSYTLTTTLALTSSGSHSYQNIDFPGATRSTFATRTDSNLRPGLPYYEAREAELNGRTRDANPMVLGNEAQSSSVSTMTLWNNNTNDRTSAAAVTNAQRETTWSVRNNSSSTWNWSEILGTSSFPDNGDANSSNTIHDIRHFMAPANGRWAINPLYRSSNSPSGITPTNNPTAEANTRAIMLSLGGTDGKVMEMRLGGDTVNNAPASGSQSYYNSLMGFDLTDNKGAGALAGYTDTLTNPFVEYYDNNNINNPQSLWHPQQWNSMSIYTQANTEASTQFGVNTRMVFGPYMHVFRYGTSTNAYGDYWNWGRYVGNPWYGQAAGDMNRAFPGNAYEEPTDFTRRGMAYIPEYYGNDTQFMLLDNSDKPVLFLQGVNILDQNNNTTPSAIYSRRGVEIGGALVKSTANYDDSRGQTTRHVNSTINGFSYGWAAVYGQYFGIGTRYSQILYNTDLVLRTPNGTSTPRTSRIFDATLPNDGAYGVNNTGKNGYDFSSNNFSSNTDKKFSPTVRIIGGDLYVGAGQTLTIDAGRINSLTATGANLSASYPDASGRVITLGDARGEYTQVIAPDSITVAEGATLILRGQVDVDGNTVNKDSLYANVNAPIYVEGTLELWAGARLTNQVYVYDKGVVNVRTSTFQRPAIVDRREGAEGSYDGIYAFNGGTVIIEGMAQLQSRIWIDSDSSLSIDLGATVTGDISVLGSLTLKNSFTLNYDARDLVDNPTTSNTFEDQPATHGIYLYNDPAAGSATLTISLSPIIAGTSGRIHNFGTDPTLTGAAASLLFCEDRDLSTNSCQHWLTLGEFWIRQKAQAG